MSRFQKNCGCTAKKNCISRDFCIPCFAWLQLITELIKSLSNEFGAKCSEKSFASLRWVMSCTCFQSRWKTRWRGQGHRVDCRVRMGQHHGGTQTRGATFCFNFLSRFCNWLIMMITFINLNSFLEPLIEGQCGSNPCEFEFSGLDRIKSTT